MDLNQQRAEEILAKNGYQYPDTQTQIPSYMCFSDEMGYSTGNMVSSYQDKEEDLYIATKTCKILLLGDKNVGKTSFARYLACGEFEDIYVPTESMRTFGFLLRTNVGHIYVDFHEYTEGQIPSDMDAIIIMIDETCEESVEKWYNLVAGKNIPIILCCNKVDLNNIKPFQTPYGVMYNISVKNDHNLLKPILHIIRSFCKNDSVRLTRT